MFRFLLPLLLCAAAALAAPRINEVQSTNTVFPDPFGQFIDWVEIHNASDAAISLEGHYLSDSTSNRLKFQFPADTTIAPRGYLLVWCGQISDFPINDSYPAGQIRAIGFAIGSGGEPIVLSAPDGTTVLDEFPALVIGSNNSIPRSLGRGLADQFETLFFYTTPTPNAANTTPGTPSETLQPPTVSIPGGMFTSNVTLELAASNGTTIRYTLDGSDPNESSPVYTGPIAFGPGGNTATGYSWIPTNRQNFSYDESWQPPEGSIKRINVLRARAFKPGIAPSPIATHSYLVDPAGADRYPFPVISINADPAGLFSDETGIYVHGSGDFPNYFRDGSAWERPGQIEFFEQGGATAFRGNMGVRLHGNTSVTRPRKSLRIYAREVDGSAFNYRIFPDKEIDKFSTFLLRNSGNDWGQAMLRDAFLTRLAAHTGVDHQSSRPAVVFLNGEYWGLHNLRDRIDEGYYLQHHGLGEMEFTQLDVHWQPEPLRPHWPVYDRGNPAPAILQDFEDILNRAQNNEFASEASFATIADRIDVENYIDYNAYQIFSGNGDWPANNTRLWRAVVPDRSPGAAETRDGRWRWILFDTDMGLGLNFDYVPGWNSDAATHAQVNTLAYATAETQNSFADHPDGTLLLRKLAANPVFRAKFINRFADLLNTAMSPARTTAELDGIQALYAPGVPEHKSRWRQPYNWSGDMDRIRTFLQVRPAAIRGHIASKFGLSGTANLTVDLSNPSQGTIQVNTIPIDPSTPGVSASPYPWTGTYFKNLPVTLTALPKPGHRFVSWSTTSAPADEIVASDSASNYSSWSEGSNFGNGFGPWVINRTTGNSDNAGTFLDNSRGGWGLYANESQAVSAHRNLNTPLQVGQTFTARVRHGSVDEPGDVGFDLSNNSGEVLFQLKKTWWSDTYLINENSTSIPAISGPFDLQVTLVSESSYSARITPVGGTTYTHNGTLNLKDNRTISRFLAYNYSAGGGGGADVFVTSLQISNPAGSGGESSVYSTNSTITATLSSAAAFTASFELEPATTLLIETPPAAIPGTALQFLRVKAVNSVGDTDGNYDAQPVTLVITGPNGFEQILQGTMTAGVAEFPGIILPATGEFSLAATSGSLATASPQTFSPSASARFLPAGNATWTTAANWDIQAVPNNTLAGATLPAPPNQTVNRDISIQAPVTIASVVFENGASAWRNRITGTSGNTLTFASANGTSSITVTGNGTGHANIELPAGVVLQNDIVLDVQNAAATQAEYGALRLQGSWSGPGGFIKRGPGLAGITGAGKTFSGNITIEQGVLTFTEPSVTANTASRYTVLPGGQLRLSSAGNPRIYGFSGPIHLSGNGRLGVPENENLGVLGALRLETGATGTNAVINNSVVLDSHADIHVPSLNTVTLNRTLVGDSTLSKSGGGTLHLSASTAGFAGGIAVQRGTLHLAGNLSSSSGNLHIASESTLSGNGTWGGLLRLPSGSILSFDPSSGPLRTASVRIDPGALVSVTTTAQTAPGRYPLLVVGDSSAELSNLDLASVPPLHPQTRLLLEGDTLFVLVAANTREAWLLEYNLTPGSTDDSDSDADGFPLLLERALGMDPTTPEAGIPATIASESGGFVFTYRVARGQTDLAVVPEYTRSLTESWAEISSALHDDTHPRHEVRRVLVPEDTAGFLRLGIRSSGE